VLRGLVDRYARVPQWLRCVPPLLVAVAIFWLSAQSQLAPAPNDAFEFLFNGAHIIAYGSLGGGLLLALPGAAGMARWHLPVAVLAAACYGVTDEVHQRFVPGRCCSVADVCSDAAGALLACTLIVAVQSGSRRAWRALPFVLLFALASVSTATWTSL
jgi:VanZ family protein